VKAAAGWHTLLSCTAVVGLHGLFLLYILLCAALLVQGCSSEALARTKTDYDAFLADPSNLKAVKEQLQV
jgi:hypothetical protein